MITKKDAGTTVDGSKFDPEMREQYLNALKSGEFSQTVIYEIPLADIYADSAFNVRGDIQPLSVLELSKEIQQQGLIQPITVQPFTLIPERRFRIVAGHRRYAAHEILGWVAIKATVIKGLSDLQARIINLSENTQREQLTIMQEAKAVSYFKMAGWTQDEVGLKLGKSRGWAQTRFYLLDLPVECQMEADAGQLSQADIHQLWRLRDFGYETQMTLLTEIKEAKGRGKKKTVKAEKVTGKDKKIRTESEIFDMQEILQEKLGVTHVAAKALAWAAGVIDSAELEEAASTEAALV